MFESLSPVLGRVPSGVFILTVRQAEQETGMLASWVMQAGFDPPMLTAAIRQGRPAAEWLTAGAPFVVNLVADGQHRLLRHFAAGFEPHEAAFEGLAIHRSAKEIVILDDALGYLECEPVGHLDGGDHRIFLAKITGGAITGDLKPMVHIRKNGLRY